MSQVMKFAASVPDFRRTSKGNLRHKLNEVIILIILARLSKCVGRVEIIQFGRHNLKRFRSMGMFKNGIPSEATLCRIDQGIDELSLAQRMAEFISVFRNEFNHGNEPDIISIDGKAQRGTLQENGRNPDIVSAYSNKTGMTLATEACQEKSNEIKAVPILLDNLHISGDIITADAMSMQKEIIDKIREKGADFVIELKANQRALRYGIEDRIEHHSPLESYTEGPELSHGRIETRTYRIFDGLKLIADKDKWGGNLTVVEFISETIKKSTAKHTTERRLYLTSLSADAKHIGSIIRQHWMIESMHWSLDKILHQDHIKRKITKAARNLDTLQRIVHAIFSIWKARRKKRSDKSKGITELMRNISLNFTRLMLFLSQK